MAKDPATLWYWNDWHGGTVTFSRHLKGCYMDLLYAQFNVGRLSLEEIKTVLGNDFASWGALSKKFVQDEHGLFYNERAENEKLKRKKFSESRRKNLSGDDHMGTHMENENEDIIIKRKGVFLESLQPFKEKYSDAMITAFYEYWTERKPNGKKLRYEFEKVFEISKRLATWFRKDEESRKFDGKGKTIQMGFPDHYDRAFEIKLTDGKQLSKYWQHLHTQGYRPKKNHAGDIIDWIKSEVA